MKKYLCIPVISLFFFSCQKELNPDDLQGSGGTGGGSNPPSTVCDTYFPVTNGSTWTYDHDGSTQVNTVITPDTLMQGKVFKRIRQDVSGTIVNSFFMEENKNLFAFIDLNNNGIASGKVLLNLLRSNAAVGDQCRDTIVINGFIERFEFTMMERDINRQVGTLNFNNVHHVQFKVRVDFPPLMTDQVVQTTDEYFAKCVGPIESTTQFSFSGINSTSSTKIKSYSIK